MQKLIAFILLVVLASCQQEPKIDQKAEEEKLMQVSRDWAKTLSVDSIDKIMSYWADSAIFLSGEEGALYGKPAIRKMVEESSKIPGFTITWEPLSASVSKSGDMGYLIEKNQITVNDSTGKQLLLHGRVVTIWKKDADGNWKNVVEISVPDRSKD